jgi:hypothetical protein
MLFVQCLFDHDARSPGAQVLPDIDGLTSNSWWTQGRHFGI